MCGGSVMLQNRMKSSRVLQTSLTSANRSEGTGVAHFVAVTFPINMKMWDRDLLSIRVAMRGSSEIEPHEHDDLTSASLHLDLEQVDSSAAHIEEKLLARVN